MWSSLLRILCSFFGSNRYTHLETTHSFAKPAQDDVIPDYPDGLFWSCALARHSCGDMSFAMAKANNPCEDRGEVESGSFGTFVGVYDGHGGPMAASFLRDNLFGSMLNAFSDNGGVTTEALTQAVNEAESKFLEVVRANWLSKPQYASVGSCLLAGVVADGVLHVVTVGDSKAVLARKRSFMRGGGMEAVEMSRVHNANDAAEREELKRKHPGEKDIVVERSGVWRVKGIIQITRSIGDFYLKRAEFQKPPLAPRFLLPHGLPRPALCAEPAIKSQPITSADKFVIFASDGLWDYVRPDEAISLVSKHPRPGIARRLGKLALFRACRAQDITLAQLPRVDPAQRRMVHDDITVIVLFFDFDRAVWRTLQWRKLVQRETPETTVTEDEPEDEPVPVTSASSTADLADSAYSGSEDIFKSASRIRHMQKYSGELEAQGLDSLALSLKGLVAFNPVQLRNRLDEDPVPTVAAAFRR